MKIHDLVKLSVIYASFIAAITLYYGISEVIGVFISNVPYLFPITIVSLYPLYFVVKEKDWIYSIPAVLAFIASLSVALSTSQIPGDLMGGLVLILASSLIFTGLRDTYRMLYEGLSFYIVGIFLLLADTAITIIILLSDIADYYINCIGESCAPYELVLRPEIFLFFLTLFALYPFFKRMKFKRREYDKAVA